MKFFIITVLACVLVIGCLFIMIQPMMKPSQIDLSVIPVSPVMDRIEEDIEKYQNGTDMFN